MPRQSGKPSVLLDWFNVSYRTVYLGLIVLIGGGGTGYWHFFHQRPSLRASKAIERAQERYDVASGNDIDSRLQEMIASARSSLTQARASFGDRAYHEAYEAALRSESLSQRVIDIAGGARAPDTTEVRFFRIEGDVRVKRRGEFSWETADRNMVLSIGDQVKTSSSASAQIIYFDGTVTTVQPGSLLEIKELYENPVTKVRKVRQKLSWGEMMASTQKKNVEGSFHEVKTDAASARSSDGGDFRVSYDREKKTAAVDVFDGRVEVAGSSSKTVLNGGERVRASSSGKLSKKEAIPGPPRLIAPADQKIFISDDSGVGETQLTWERVAGASRYRLLISDRFLFTEPLYDAERQGTSAVIEGVEPGEYYWKVAAVSSAGVPGTFSETRQFRVTTRTIRNTGDTTPPELKITDLVQTGPMLIVNGRTEPGAQLWVDNEKVEVSDDGSFYTVVRLRREGFNDLRFIAQDAAGNQKTLRHRAYVESY